MNEEIKYEIDWIGVLKGDDFWEKLIQEDVTPQEAFGVTDQVLGMYYQAAAKYLDQGKFPEAKDAFIFLTYLNPNYPNLWLGLGVAEQHQHEFEPALNAFMKALELDPNNAACLANACQCNLGLGHKDKAKELFDKCLEACGDHHEHAEIKEGILNYKDEINKK
jgi:tetratricopeptide (TPR) repeat protein